MLVGGAGGGEDGVEVKRDSGEWSGGCGHAGVGAAIEAEVGEERSTRRGMSLRHLPFAIHRTTRTTTTTTTTTTT